MIATLAAQSVASSAVPTIAVGLVDPDATRIAIAVAGINCTELVLIARNVHIALVATPGRGFQIAHCAQAERCSCIAETEHVSRHVHYHGTHRGMFERNIREKPAHDRAQTARDPLYKACTLGQAHHAQPQRHDTDQTQCDGDGRLGAIECAFGQIFQTIVPAADRNREQNQRKPNVVQHADVVTGRADCGK